MPNIFSTSIYVFSRFSFLFSSQFGVYRAFDNVISTVVLCGARCTIIITTRSEAWSSVAKGDKSRKQSFPKVWRSSEGPGFNVGETSLRHARKRRHVIETTLQCPDFRAKLLCPRNVPECLKHVLFCAEHRVCILNFLVIKGQT